MNPNQFKTALQKLNIDLTEMQEQQLESFYQDLIRVNQQFNLTAITEKDDVYLKHYYDSLTVLPFLPTKESSMVDVGAGAGFPSIPIKIIKSNIEMTMVDSLKKRADFLNTVINDLQLSNISALHIRAEDFGQNPVNREKFDLAIGRAVASVSVLLEYLAPLVKVDGQIILMKGDWQRTEAELTAAEKALQILDCSLQSFEKITLPNNDQRSILIIKKNKQTNPNYPRKAGKPNKLPL